MTTIIAVISDLHCGSTVALCPPTVTLDDGGTYRASIAQQWIWMNWLDYWNSVEFKVKELNARLIVLVVGDAVEGDHHGTPQLISRNIETHKEVCLKSLEVPLKLNPEYIFIIRGTEVHTGKTAQYEEWLAKDIGGEPESEGVHSWYWLPLDIEGVRIEAAHHGRAGYRPHTRANATQMLAAELVLGYAERKEKPFDIAIRAHTHQSVDSYDNFSTRVLQTPSWQLSTSFGHRLSPGAMLPIGGYIISCGNGMYNVDKKIYRAKRREPWTLPR